MPAQKLIDFNQPVSFTIFMATGFQEALEYLNEFQAEIIKLKQISSSSAILLMSENNFNTLKRTLTILITTSNNLSKVENMLDAACIEALKQTEPTNKIILNNIEKIRDQLKNVSRLWLGAMQRLPFSFGSGWVAQGSISRLRHITNLVGSAMISQALLWRDNNTQEKYKAYYNRSLKEYADLVREYQEARRNRSERTEELRKDVENAVKDLKIFSNIAGNITKKWIKTQKTYKKINNGWGDTLMLNPEVIKKRSII